MTRPPDPATRAIQRTSWQATAVRLAFVIALIVLGNIAVSAAIERLEFQIWPEHLEMLDRAVITGLIVYVLLMAMPFVPGIEIGLVLMMVLGARGVLLVYLGTLLALALAFGVGRIFPPPALIALLRWLRLQRAAELVARYCEVEPTQRLDFLVEQSSTRLVPSLLRRRYLLLAILFNLPGNALIGGGGGIALMAGLSGLYSYPRYVLLVSVAILPGPILILLSERLTS